MRIPSQFNEDSLYAGRKRRGRAKDQSRLLRLVVVLALVLLVMRTASNPQIYAPFFTEAAESTSARALATDRGARAPPPSVPQQDRLVAAQLAEIIDEPQRPSISAALSRLSRGESLSESEIDWGALNRTLAELDNIGPPRRAAWSALLDLLANGSAAQKSNEDVLVSASALLTALNDAAVGTVVDGSVWRSGDFDALYRFLDQAPSLSPTGVANVGVLPLLQQPDVFRNQIVTVRGTVARCNRIEAQTNGYGIDQYWQLWLRPLDGAQRPIVVIVPHVEARLASVAAGNDTTSPFAADEISVVAVGRFLKRLAYESSIGPDLAPVVVGRVVAEPVPMPQSSGGQKSTGGWKLALLLLACCAGGLGIAAIVMWRTSIMANHARALRPVRSDLDESLAAMSSIDQDDSAVET